MNWARSMSLMWKRQTSPFFTFDFENGCFPFHLGDVDAFHHKCRRFALDRNRNIMFHGRFLCVSGACVFSYFFKPPLQNQSKCQGFLVWTSSFKILGQLPQKFPSCSRSLPCERNTRPSCSRRTVCHADLSAFPLPLRVTRQLLCAPSPNRLLPLFDLCWQSKTLFFTICSSKCFFLICQMPSLSIIWLYTKFEILCSENHNFDSGINNMHIFLYPLVQTCLLSMGEPSCHQEKTGCSKSLLRSVFAISLTSHPLGYTEIHFGRWIGIRGTKTKTFILSAMISFTVPSWLAVECPD